MMFNWIERWTTTEHERVREDLSAFLDGQLSAADRGRVERHLQECADCRAELASLRQTVSLLRAVPAVKLPRSFLLPVGEARQPARVQRRSWGYGYLQAATTVAAVLLVLVVSGDALLRFQASLPAYGLLRAGRSSPEALSAPATQEVQPVSAPRVGFQASPLVETPATAQQSTGDSQALMTGPGSEPTFEPPTAAVAGGAAVAQPASVPPAPQNAQTPAPQAQPSAESVHSPVPPAPPAIATSAETSVAPLDKTVQPRAALAITVVVTITRMPEVQPTQAAAQSVPTHTPAQGASEPQPSSAAELPTAVPTALPPADTPVPTGTPVPSIAAPLPSQEPARVAAVASPQPEDDQSHKAGGRSLSETAGWLAVVEPWRPYLPWAERGLALLLAALLGAMLVVRRRRRP
jgi:hypothetical protein